MSTATGQNPSKSAAENTYDDSVDSRPQDFNAQKRDSSGTKESTGSKFADKVTSVRNEGLVETSRFQTTEQKPVGER